MLYSIKKLLSTKSGLKLMAGVIGFSVWSWMTVDSLITNEYAMPLCFYEMPENYVIAGPETVKVALQGSRRSLLAALNQQPAVHINARELHEGVNDIFVLDQKIFLPETIKLVHCSAPIISLTKEKKA